MTHSCERRRPLTHQRIVVGCDFSGSAALEEDDLLRFASCSVRLKASGSTERARLTINLADGELLEGERRGLGGDGAMG
ncbi:MAG: hypothetical protein AAGA68_26925 [Pseudomonadota bacterium]